MRVVSPLVPPQPIESSSAPIVSEQPKPSNTPIQSQGSQVQKKIQPGEAVKLQLDTTCLRHVRFCQRKNELRVRTRLRSALSGANHANASSHCLKHVVSSYWKGENKENRLRRNKQISPTIVEKLYHLAFTEKIKKKTAVRRSQNYGGSTLITSIKQKLE